MIDSYHHIELNGVRYRLAEGGEGNHYNQDAEPLRPPNAVTVQGETQQKFQMRPDVLLWSLTDWSGGAGQIKFNPEAPNRHRKLTAVRVFDKPGTLQPGFAVTETTHASGAFATTGVIGAAVTGIGGTLYAIQETQAFEWDDTNKEWKAPVTLDASLDAQMFHIDGDTSAIYLWGTDDPATNPLKVWKWDPVHNTSTALATGPAGTTVEVTVLGDYVYTLEKAGNQVHELEKTGGSATLLDDFDEEPAKGVGHGPRMATLAGKVYVLVPMTTTTVVREITPTSAAGAGFGAEIARIHGFDGESLWSQGGVLYIAGRVGDRHTVVYLTPNQTFGTLGRLAEEVEAIQVAGSQGPTTFFSGHESGTLLSSYFASGTDDGTTHYLWEVDSVSGGTAVLAKYDPGDDSGSSASLTVLGEDIFLFPANLGSNSDPMAFRAQSGAYEPDHAEAISPWHDFSIATDKVLSSLVLSCEALPADWTIHVDYALDGDDTWTNVISYSTTGGTGTTAAVTTDTSTINFHTLSVRIRFEYTGLDDPPTTGPVLNGVDVRAAVVKKLRRWRLLLDLADSHEQSNQTKGSQKIENIRTAAVSEEAVDFKDGYENREPGQFEQYDVFIDRHSIDLSKPGEGTALVDLLEVVS